MRILVTGCAGFIGSNLCDRLLLDEKNKVVGIDNFNDYYDPKIKENNLKSALNNKNFELYKLDILNFDKLKAVFKKEKIDVVVNLAARAGVRPSIVDPLLYSQVNVLGTVNLLKLAVDFKVKKFVFGSSSSVYGNSKKVPFTENDPCQNIISPYAASKRSAEFWVETFYRTYGLKSIVLRFFTVYGPRGRVDMAPSIFTNAIMSGDEILIFGNGNTSRDYTYIDDITNGVVKAINSDLDFQIINLGNNKPVKLKHYVKHIEKVTGKKAKLKHISKQAGDVDDTWANIDKAKNLFNWSPEVGVVTGLQLYKDHLENEA